MQRYRIGISSIPFFILGLSLTAQVNSVSPYSRLGLGEFQPQNYVRALGLGGASQAMRDGYHINFTNPASYGHLELTTFEMGFSASRIRQEQRNPDFSLENGTAGMRYLSFAVPLEDFWTSAIGLQPYTSVGFDVNSSRYGPDSIFITDRHLGTGGLNRVYWGNAFNLAPGLSLGFNASYIFGKLREQNLINWGGGIHNSNIDQTLRPRGFVFDYGLQYHYRFANNTEVGLGLSYTNSTRLNTEVERYAFTLLDNGVPVDSLVQTGEAEIVMPNELRLGLVLGKRNRNTTDYSWAVLADMEWYQGSEFVHFNGRQPLADAYRLELGGLINPVLAFEDVSRSGNYLAQIEYRIGAYYEKTPLVVRDQQLEDYGITFGMGLPVRQRNLGPGEKRRSLINAGLMLGRRGSLENGLFRESYLRVFVGITLNDKWFIKYKYR